MFSYSSSLLQKARIHACICMDNSKDEKVYKYSCFSIRWRTLWNKLQLRRWGCNVPPASFCKSYNQKLYLRLIWFKKSPRGWIFKKKQRMIRGNNLRSSFTKKTFLWPKFTKKNNTIVYAIHTCSSWRSRQFSW